MRNLLPVILLLCGLRLPAQEPRAYFHARYEPRHGVLIGAGQVDAEDVKHFASALRGVARPAIFMDYVDVHTRDPEQFFRELDGKLSHLGWYAVPQIGLGMDDDAGHPYDGQVAGGLYDPQIHKLAGLLKALHRPVFLRIGYEFHGSWNGYQPASYVAAFRRIVHILRQERVHNVATVWCAESAALPAGYREFYPGDDAVDWWAIDLFEASSFTASVVETFMRDASHARKPVMIGESTPRHVGVLDGAQSWNAWFAPYFDFIARHANVKAFCYINWEWRLWASRYSADWADWGDARIQMNAEVSRRMAEELAKPLYIKAAAEQKRAW